MSTNNPNQNKPRKEFYILYYVSGVKKVQSRVWDEDIGYNMMCKIAASMAPGLLAMAVHPDDVKNLIPDLHKLGGNHRDVPTPDLRHV